MKAVWSKDGETMTLFLDQAVPPFIVLHVRGKACIQFYASEVHELVEAIKNAGIEKE